MSRIALHHIHIQTVCEAQVLDSEHALDFEQFVLACGQETTWVLQLFEHDILSRPSNPQSQHYLSEDVARARKAYRLQRDFDASLQAVAVMLDLLDEVQDLRRQLSDW